MSKIALDPAGPLIRKNKCWYLPGFFNGGINPNIATKTFAVHTNPCFFGTKNFNSAKVNILVNPNKFCQPGTNGQLYNHMFAVAITASMSDNTFCAGDKHSNGKIGALMNHASVSSVKNLVTTGTTQISLNFFYANIDDGTYQLVTQRCYPFCCKGDKPN